MKISTTTATTTTRFHLNDHPIALIPRLSNSLLAIISSIMRKYFQIGFICFWPIDLELVTGFIQMANSQEMISSTELMLELV